MLCYFAGHVLRFGWVRPLFALLATLLVATPGLAHQGVEHDIATESAKLRKDPRSFEHLLRRGHLFRLAHEYEKSLGDLNRARRLSPKDARVYFQLGMTLSALRREAQAQAMLQHSIALGIGTAGPHVELGWIQLRNRQYRRAIEHFERALRLRADVGTYLALGQSLEALSRLPRAAALYSEGYEKTRAESLLKSLIRVRVAQGEHQAALELSGEALRRATVKIDWRLERARVLTALGRLSEARRERVLALAEANQRVQRRGSALDLLARARAQLDLGHPARAKLDLRRALKLTPNLEPARQLFAELTKQSIQP